MKNLLKATCNVLSDFDNNYLNIKIDDHVSGRSFGKSQVLPRSIYRSDFEEIIKCFLDSFKDDLLKFAKEDFYPHGNKEKQKGEK